MKNSHHIRPVNSPDAKPADKESGEEYKPKNTAAGADSREREKLPGLLWSAFFFVLAYISSYSLSGAARPSLELDDSWQVVLEHAARYKWQFGKDIVFTYGPLGYLNATFGQGLLIPQRIAFSLFWSAVVAWSASDIARRLSGPVKIIFMAWFLLFFSTYGMEAQAILVMIHGCLILGDDVQRRRPAAIFFIMVFALLSLIKFTFFISAIAGIVIVSAVQFGRKQIKTASFIMVFFACAFLFLWRASSQHLMHLWPWIKGSLEITGGFAEAMATPPETWVLRACITAGAVFLIGCIVYTRTQQITMSSAGYYAILAFSLFLSWKHSFVRAHDHVYEFIYLLPVAFALLLSGPDRQAVTARTQRALIILNIAIIALCSWSAYFQGDGRMLTTLIGWPKRFVDNAALIGKAMAGKQDECFSARQAPPGDKSAFDLAVARKLIGQDTVDVIGYRQLAALGNNLNYHPRPVFQGYAAYTPYLQDLNFAFFQSGERPQFLLLSMESIDFRYPPLDDSMVLPFILKNYELIGQDGRFVILKQLNNAAAGMQMQLIQEQTITRNMVLDLSRWTNELLMLQVDVKTNFYDRVRGFFYQPPILYMNLLAGGKEIKMRCIPAMAKRGFLIGPVLSSNYDVINLSRRIGFFATGVSFFSPENGACRTSDEIRVKLYRII